MPDQLAIGADAAGQRLAQPGLVRAALRRRDRVAIGMAEAVLFVFWPHDGPLDAASPWAAIREFGAAEKRLWRQQRPLGEARGEEIAEPVRKMQPRFLRYAVGPRHRSIAAPANLDGAEQIRLRSRHTVEERRGERGVGKNFGIGVDAEGGLGPGLHGA